VNWSAFCMEKKEKKGQTNRPKLIGSSRSLGGIRPLKKPRKNFASGKEPPEMSRTRGGGWGKEGDHKSCEVGMRGNVGPAAHSTKIVGAGKEKKKP